MVAGLYDESLDAFAPHSWMQRFNVFRQDASYRQMQQFANTPEGFQHVFGKFRRELRECGDHLPFLPPELVQNMWGMRLRGFGLGGALAKGGMAQEHSGGN